MTRWLCLLFALLVILACGGGGGGVGGGGGGLTMDPAKRSAAITKAEDKQEQLLAQSLTMAQRVTQMADYLKTLPEFSTAGTTPDLSAWGRFTDGGHLVISFNRMPDWRLPGNPNRQTFKESKAAMVSKGTNAKVLHSFGLGFTDGDTATTKIKSLLTKGGYTVRLTTDGEATVQQLRAITGDGYFYFNTHGGSFEDTSVTKRFCMQTSTVRTPLLDTQVDIAADLATTKLVWMTAPNGLKDAAGKAISDTRYAITADWVKAYWTFQPNAIAHFNVCYSSYVAASNGAQNFIKACQDAGAAVHLGWSEAVQVGGSLLSAQYLVDRLVAGNDVQKENPDQRPFLVKEIMTDMTGKGLIPVAGVNLVASFKAGVTNVGLRPTIEHLTMQEQLGQLDIHGEFGSEKGQVFVEGVEAANVQWTEKEITCEIPAQGTGSFGDVWVKVHGKESNKRQLTMWTGTFSYTETGDGTLKCTANGTLKVRQDLAYRRNKPGGGITNVDPIPFFAAPGSTCSFNASGSHVNGPIVIEAWSGSGQMTLTTNPVITASALWTANGAFDPVTEEFLVSVVAGGPKQISGEVGNASVVAAALGRVSQLNLGTWTVAAYDSPAGSVRWSFSAMTPQKPPASDLQYGPIK